jgi:FkbM family methyltransferase
MLMVEKGMAGATGNIYCGLLEFEEMMFTLHLLRKNDLFGDIGANIGVYSVLASKNAGADVIAVEPIPSTFKKLESNLELNKIKESVEALQMGAGQENGHLAFTQSSDTVNHVAEAMELVERNDIISIPVKTIDDIFKNRAPLLLKIDIEGFEWPALNGALKTLESQALKSIIIELNGSGRRYGYNDDEIHLLLLHHGFSPFSYEPFGRKIKKLEKYTNTNTIYIRDIDWVNERLAGSVRYSVTGIAI